MSYDDSIALIPDEKEVRVSMKVNENYLNENAWQPITTAPKDGNLIYVEADCGCFLMRWNSIGSNLIVQPKQTGIWQSPNGAFTWSDDEGFGPQRWQPYKNDLKHQPNVTFNGDLLSVGKL